MLQASIASKHQMLLGSCLTAHASGASPSLGELPQRMLHVRNEPIPRRLLSCGASYTPRRAFVRGMLYSTPLLSQPRASSAAPACILFMLPQASARAACAWSVY